MSLSVPHPAITAADIVPWGANGYVRCRVCQRRGFGAKWRAMHVQEVLFQPRVEPPVEPTVEPMPPDGFWSKLAMTVALVVVMTLIGVALSR